MYLSIFLRQNVAGLAIQSYIKWDIISCIE